jgi:hypothetical protein
LEKYVGSLKTQELKAVNQARGSKPSQRSCMIFAVLYRSGRWQTPYYKDENELKVAK